MPDLSLVAPHALPVLPPNTVIRVAIVDADELRLEGLAVLVERSEDMSCVGAWSSDDEALVGLRGKQPDVLLVHVKLANQACFTLLKELALKERPVRVLAIVDCIDERCPVLTPNVHGLSRIPDRMLPQPFSEPDDCLQIALKLGAHGVLRNPCNFQYVARAVRSVYTGQYWIEYPIAARLARQYLISLQSVGSTAKVGPESLTLRERQVLTLVAQGRSNKDIARELQLSYSTVKNYVSSILEKLGLNDRTQLALRAIEFSLNEDHLMKG